MTGDSRTAPAEAAPGDEIEVNGERLLILGQPRFKAERDAAYYIVRARLLSGDGAGEEGWLISDQPSGPWEPAGGGVFV